VTRAAKAAAQTPQARLASVIKSSRDIMRKDAGLNGDLDRLPQLSWLLFLKAFDDLEHNRMIVDPAYRPALPEALRWGAWAADPTTRRQGDALITWVNQTLLPGLARLEGSGTAGDPRTTLATVFKETNNRMLSGYLLGDLIDQIDKVQFASADDIHTMALLYESMLREMRDAAGDSGEFYTPRPVIRLMVEQVDPRLGETVLDPAVGTGGFLVEAYEHLRAQAQSASKIATAKKSISGFEKKPLPYLLCQMNLLLHEVEQPKVTRTNSLTFPLADQRKAGVDVVLTNPPFGGEEESSSLENFPADSRTAETAWLFLQVVMARLEQRKGRCGIVVPNSVLFASEGAPARIKKKLLTEFALHTVVRLPDGVFAPYTLIPSNLLFFEYGGPTKDIWFYEQPLPEGRKNYTKTKPLRFEEFEGLQAWWGGRDRVGRIENEHAWKVDAATVEADGYNLDLRNPHRADDLAHRSPEDLVTELIAVEEQILATLRDLQVELGNTA
jgi:type I restriction enzyme M protein